MYIPSLPSHTHHPPPTLPHRDTQGVGEREPSAEWRIKASHIPPALVSPHNLGSAMSSPVTLPYINLDRRQIEKRDEVKTTYKRVKAMHGQCECQCRWQRSVFLYFLKSLKYICQYVITKRSADEPMVVTPIFCPGVCCQ